ncbi:MAG: N-acetyltransferase family protein [Planctomycetota bacterium]|nr:N-acetyltransferase [Planctomycetaceae bacterium]MDQ3329823.1 N-acetyltransferase family protein [Planctomycetota bacterium]
MNNTTVILRPAASADIPEITQIYADHVRDGTGTFELEPPDEAEIARRMQAIAERGLPWLVADREGEIAGYAYAGPFRARPAYDWLVEDSIYLRSDCLRIGIGSLLLDRLIDHCTELGHRQMLALIGDSANEPSIRVHRRAGFRHVGVMPSVGWKHDRWLDVVLMQRELGPGDSRPADARLRR